MCWPRTAPTSAATPRRSRLSAHVRLGEDRDYTKVVDEAAALGAEGLDLAIIYLPPPYDPAVLEPLAEAIRDSGQLDALSAYGYALGSALSVGRVVHFSRKTATGAALWPACRIPVKHRSGVARRPWPGVRSWLETHGSSSDDGTMTRQYDSSVTD